MKISNKNDSYCDFRGKRTTHSSIPPNAAIACATMECRPGCAACCIAPSISTPIPGLPQGKPAGQVCVQLDAQMQCRLFGQLERPAVCVSLAPEAAMCGAHRQQALNTLMRWERQTSPG